MDTLLYSRQYADLDAKLTGRCSKSRKVANNTYLERRADGDIAVRLHATDVVTFHADGTATLDSGGWLTVTTKARMNDYLPGGIVLSSIKGRWYLVYPGHWDSATDTYVKSERPAVPYSDGITLDLASLDVIGGEAAAEAVKLEDSANEAMRKAVAKYVAKTTADDIVKAFTHVVGDCMFCAGYFGDEHTSDADHLAQHVEEQYVMYSLAKNAVTERGFRYPDVILSMIYSAAQRGQVDRIYKDSVRKYLRKHLTVGACATK